MGLTSLKDKVTTKPDFGFPKDSPEYKEQARLSELRGGIVSASREKDSLADEIKSLEKKRNFLVDSMDSKSKVRTINKEKDTILKQIKELKKARYDLEEEIELIGKKAEEKREKMIHEMEDFSKKSLEKLKKKDKRLEKKNKELEESSDFLVELEGYIFAYAQILEAEKLLNERRGVFLEKKDRDTTKTKKETEKSAKEVDERLKRAKEMEKSIGGRYEKADKICGWFEEEADKEKHRLNVWAKTVALREKNVVSVKKGLGRTKLKLEQMEKRLLDKEATLVRSARELEIRAGKLGIVL